MEMSMEDYEDFELCFVDFEFSDDDNEYTKDEIKSILELLKNRSDNDKSEWKFEKKPREHVEVAGKLHLKRDVKLAADALARADYKCEVDGRHKTFKSIANKPYTEAYHLVPVDMWYKFKNSLDIPENIVSLCSHCHNILKYGTEDEKYKVLIKLWEQREEALEKCGIKLTIEEFFKFYGMLVTITV